MDYDTPIGLAVRKGREEIVSLLLTAGADRNKKFGPVNDTPLAVAAKCGYVSSLRLLAQARPTVAATAPKKAKPSKPHGPARKGSLKSTQAADASSPNRTDFGPLGKAALFAPARMGTASESQPLTVQGAFSMAPTLHNDSYLAPKSSWKKTQSPGKIPKS